MEGLVPVCLVTGFVTFSHRRWTSVDGRNEISLSYAGVCHVVGFGGDESLEDDASGSNARGRAPCLEGFGGLSGSRALSVRGCGASCRMSKTRYSGYRFPPDIIGAHRKSQLRPAANHLPGEHHSDAAAGTARLRHPCRQRRDGTLS
jgi:hypothetical protein